MFEMTRGPDALAVAMSAELENIDRACAETKKLLWEKGLEAAEFSVLLGLREALTNAVLHGSGRDPARRVRCAVDVDGGSLAVSVEDEGAGFDWRSAPCGPPSPDAVGGRGLAIMRCYFEEVRHNDRGNCVLMKGPRGKGQRMSEIKREGAAAVFRPGREVTASAADALRRELKELIDDGVTGLTVDLEGVEMIDSIGMGLFIAAHNSLLKKGGRLKVKGASGDLDHLLRTMRLDKHFEIQAD